jgi:hypothetical protein
MGTLRSRIEVLESKDGIGEKRIDCIAYESVFPPPGAQQPYVIGARSLRADSEWYLPRDDGEGEEAFIKRAQRYAVEQLGVPGVARLVLEYDPDQVAKLEAANALRT